MSQAEPVTLYLGDCLDILRQMPDNSIDALVTDPPAGISFMGKEWDHDKGGRDAWVAWLSGVMSECLRVLKPGAHALVWALPRTSHWTGWALEEAGFEVRDRIAHLFGSGFPKSLDVSKAIDKMAGAEREVVPGRHIAVAGEMPIAGPAGRCITCGKWRGSQPGNCQCVKHSAPATPAAVQWQGWGTALKPACEDWWLCRKPLAEGTVAANVLEWGTGAINVDGCRVGTIEDCGRPQGTMPHPMDWGSKSNGDGSTYRSNGHPLGRFPANVTHDGSEEVLAGFPNNRPGSHDQDVFANRKGGIFPALPTYDGNGKNDSGSAARFFMCCPPDKEDQCEKNDQLVRYAASQCASCETCIVAEAAGIKPLDFRIGASPAIAACIGSYSGCTQTRNLAPCVANQESTDITQTMPSPLTSCGYVQLAIDGSTKSGNGGGKANTLSGVRRFAYFPKASRQDREEGCEGLELTERTTQGNDIVTWIDRKDGRGPVPVNAKIQPARNFHPTVKPTPLMRWLCRLITPPGGTVLDPFMGSGSTGKAATLEGFGFIGIELDPEYFEIAKRRIGAVQHQPQMVMEL